MPRLPFGRILLLAPLALIATAASALELKVESTGKGAVLSFVSGSEYILTADETTIVAQTTDPESPSFDSVSFGFVRVAGKSEATVACQDEASLNTLNLVLSVESDATVAGVRTISGTWTYLSGNGEYSDYSKKTSFGRWTFRWSRVAGTTSLDLQGELKDRGKPEAAGPVAFSAMALGAPVLLRRRRR